MEGEFLWIMVAFMLEENETSSWHISRCLLPMLVLFNQVIVNFNSILSSCVLAARI